MAKYETMLITSAALDEECVWIGRRWLQSSGTF